MAAAVAGPAGSCSRARLRAGALVLGAERLRRPARPRRRRRLSGKRRADDRVCQLQGPGKMVGLVFSTQALGLIIGPLVALGLLGAGTSSDVAWRVLLGLGAVPAAAVIYLRRRMPESPRYQVQVQGRTEEAASQIADFTRGQVNGDGSGALCHEMGLRAFLTNRRYLIMLAGTAGTWFLLDYAYYGNTISTPQILGL